MQRSSSRRVSVISTIVLLVILTIALGCFSAKTTETTELQAIEATGVSVLATTLKPQGTATPPVASSQESQPVRITSKDGAAMRLIPAGEFQMGTDASEVPALLEWANQWDSWVGASWFECEVPRHTVSLEAFYLDVYEVTAAQYATFLNAYGKSQDEAGNKFVSDLTMLLIEKVGNEYRPNPVAANFPVVGVSWYGAVAYASYYGKRLPTEAEWEYAARGGLVGKNYPWGDTISHDDANYKDTDDGKDQWKTMAPVGSFAPNGYGLYDMAGNAYEWCADWYGVDYYANSPKRNPKGPDLGEMRVLRGGSWNNNPYQLRVAGRFYFLPHLGFQFGFRCAVRLNELSGNGD